MLYFTSDLHLGHGNAIDYANRPFSSVEEMNERLLQNVNDSVRQEDVLWILGDFAYRVSREDVRAFREKILCKNVHLAADDDLNLRIYDVGVDANEYRPVSIEQIASLMRLTPVKV